MMQITPHNKKKIISVLGMPHAGTTIVCNIFNSMDNVFCLSEPHWTLLSNPSALRLDKALGLNITSPDEVLNKIRAKLNSDNKLQFAGLKETYRPKEPRMKKYFKNMLDSDIVTFIFREPKAHYNSFKLLSKRHNKNPMPIEFMIDSYESLYNALLATKKTGISIILEDLCGAGDANAIKYINSRAKNIFAINGPFDLKPTNYIYGNHQANRSKKIAKANTSIDLLTPAEIKILNDKLLPKYELLRSI